MDHPWRYLRSEEKISQMLILGVEVIVQSFVHTICIALKATTELETTLKNLIMIMMTILEQLA